MHAAMARRRIADGGRHMVILIADVDFGANSVSIAFFSSQPQGEPVVFSGADILPKLGWLTQRGNDNINSSIVVEICKSRAAMSALHRETLTRAGRYVRECSVTAVQKDAVVLFVFGCFKRFHSVIHMRICSEDIFPAVVVEVEHPDAPAAVYSAESTHVARISCVCEMALPLVSEQWKRLAGKGRGS